MITLPYIAVYFYNDANEFGGPIEKSKTINSNPVWINRSCIPLVVLRRWTRPPSLDEAVPFIFYVQITIIVISLLLMNVFETKRKLKRSYR